MTKLYRTGRAPWEVDDIRTFAGTGRHADIAWEVQNGHARRRTSHSNSTDLSRRDPNNMNEHTTPNILQRMVAKRDQGGFTLIELLIVIIILAILAAIVVFAVGSTNTNAIASSCNADAKSVETALEAYKAQVGIYPSSTATLTSGPTPTTINGVNETVGPWLKELPATNNYIISADSTGAVSVAGPGGNPAAALYTNAASNPCNKL
jgi:type II secretion system protein G